MADRITTLANPGSDRNPLQLDMLMLAPRPLTEGPALESMSDEEAVFALAAVVTREGRISDYELLHAERESSGGAQGGSSHDEVNALLDTVKQSRFAPAQTPDGAVAVNVVWLLARTTVKASIDPNDPGTLAPLTAPDGDEVVKPLSDALGAAGASPRALVMLFSASVARMITPRAAVAPSRTSSNCSARESAMPSFG